MTKKRLYTIGHSTRTFTEFVEMLHAHDVRAVVDVRTIPRSRHNPQYNIDELKPAFAEVGIEYEHMSGLGGLRHPRKDTANSGWENASFRGYADYMQTEDFIRNVDALIAFAKKISTAIMCAEAVPWRCHRSLISDALLVRGWKVLDIMSVRSVKQHSLTPWAVVHGQEITYPKPEDIKASRSLRN